VDKITSNEWGGVPKPIPETQKSGEISTPNMEVNIKNEPVPIYNKRGRIIGFRDVKEIKLSPNQNTKSAEGISKRAQPKGGVTVVEGGGPTPSSDDTQAQDSGGGKIPIFDPGMMRDPSKIKTLGILIM